MQPDHQVKHLGNDVVLAARDLIAGVTATYSSAFDGPRTDCHDAGCWAASRPASSNARK
jgi:hypothetical protein